jgi:anaerobic selenocysteine-containing dehydrogenase
VDTYTAQYGYALQIAIANVWFKGGTYDKEYVETHCVGMDKYEHMLQEWKME